MSIRDLKSEIGESTWKMLGLGIVTFGIYYFIWLIERYKIFNRLSARTIIDRNFILITAGIMGIGHIFALISTRVADNGIGGIGSLFSIGGTILFIVMAFRMAHVLEEHIRNELQVVKHFNAFYLVIFNIFYINYIIQDLDQIEQESNRRHNQTQNDSLAQLEKLAELKGKGVLSDEEFQTQKAKLLS